MTSRLNKCALVFVCWLIACGSTARAAAPGVSDLTDFIALVGGYLYEIAPLSNNTKAFYWEQMSYKIAPAGTGTNITTITRTTLKGAMVYTTTSTVSDLPTTGLPPPWTTTPPTTYSTSLTPCNADGYEIEAVTLDMRNLKQASMGTPMTLNAKDGNKTIYPVTLTVNGGNLIRINTQELAANCQPGKNPNAHVEQKDHPSYDILFSDQGQAQTFVALVNSVVPALNPLNLTGAH